MAKITACIDGWPLFVTVLPASLGPGDIDVYIAEVMKLYERRQRFASLIDTRALTHLPGAVERKRLADWQNDTIDLIARYNVCTATVIASPLLRGAMTAMNWVFRPPNEQFATATFEEAFRGCTQRLVADRQVLHPALGRMAAGNLPRDLGEVLQGLRSHGHG